MNQQTCNKVTQQTTGLSSCHRISVLLLPLLIYYYYYYHKCCMKFIKRVAGLIGDFCVIDADCYVANSICLSSQCQCRDEMTTNNDNTACIGQYITQPFKKSSAISILILISYTFVYVFISCRHVSGVFMSCDCRAVRDFIFLSFCVHCISCMITFCKVFK